MSVSSDHCWRIHHIFAVNTITMAPKPGSDLLRHFLLSLERIEADYDSIPTNREVLGHIYKLYGDRPKEEYRVPLKHYFPATVTLLTTIWSQLGRVPLKRFVIEKKLHSLLMKYRRNLDKMKNVDFGYLYEIFDIEKKEPEKMAVGNVSLLDSIEELSENETDDDHDPDYLPGDSNECDSDHSGKFGMAIIPKHSRHFNIKNISAAADRRNISSCASRLYDAPGARFDWRE